MPDTDVDMCPRKGNPLECSFHLAGICECVKSHGTKRTTETPDVTQGACRGGPTLALSEASGQLSDQCVVCGMIVDAGRAEHFLFGFKARCQRGSAE